MPLNTSRLATLAGRPGLTADVVSNRLQGESLSATRANRDLGRESVRVRNEAVGLQNKALKDQLDQLPALRQIRIKAAQGDKLAQMQLTGLDPDQMLKIQKVVDNMGAAEGNRRLQAAQTAASGIISQIPLEKDPQKKAQLIQGLGALGYFKEAMDFASQGPKIHNLPAGGELRDNQGNLIASNPRQAADQKGFGGGIVAESQNRLIELKQKRDRGEELTSTEEMIAEIAMNNLQQERTTFKQGPEGQNVAITTRPELPGSIKREFGREDKSEKIDVQQVTGPASSKKEQVQSNKIIKQMNRAKRTALEISQFIQNNPSTVGLAGQAKKIGGAIANTANVLLPGDPLPVSTDTKRLERKIILLQSDLRSLIDEGRFSDDDRRKLNELSNATGWQDSTDSAIEMLQDIGRFADQKIMDEGGTTGEDQLMQLVEEEARKNVWNEDEKQRALEILRSRQNGNP